jgi:serine/threonine protein kinase
MAHAHAAGIVHRDLKPANLFLACTPDGREIVKVLDFGIAKLSPVVKHDGAHSGALTGEHSMLGSPSYMSPEQVRDSSLIDQRADLWALGVVLYEMITGYEPFPGGSVGEIFGAILHSKPRPLRELRPDTPVELEAAIEECLAREPNDRFADVAELARALAPFGSGAWSGHVARIEQTLARARRSSDPASSPRLSLPAMRARSSSIPVTSASRPGQTPRMMYRRSGSAGTEQNEIGPKPKETIAEPSSERPVEEPQRARHRSHWIMAMAGLAFGATVTALGVLAVARLRATSPVEPSAAAPPSSAPVTSLPVPSSFTREVPSDHAPTDAGLAVRPSPRRPQPAPAKARAQSPKGLPGVLDSPD